MTVTVTVTAADEQHSRRRANLLTGLTRGGGRAGTRRSVSLSDDRGNVIGHAWPW